MLPYLCPVPGAALCTQALTHRPYRTTAPRRSMCIRHRCTLYGMNKCAAKYGYTDPQGAQLRDCACGCCREQCMRAKGCSATPPAAVVEKTSAREQLRVSNGSSGKLLAAGAVAGTLLLLGIVLANVFKSKTHAPA